MKNETAYFAIDNISKRLISLGVGGRSEQDIQVLVDAHIEEAKANNETLSFDPSMVLTLNQLYRIVKDGEKFIHALPDGFGEEEVDLGF